MKKFVVAIVAALSLSACGDSSESPEPTPTETVTASAPTVTVTPEAPEAPASTDEIFLDLVRSEYPVLRGVPDDSLVGVATEACGAFDRGASVQEILNILMDTVSPEYQEAFAYATGAGVGVYCPEYASLFEDYLSQGV